MRKVIRAELDGIENRKEAIRQVIRSELVGIKKRMDAMEASQAAMARLARTVKDESKIAVPNSQLELGAAVANHTVAIERERNRVEREPVLLTTEQ